MDYNPVNMVALEERKAGTTTTRTTIGPYDYWAIEYGYTPLKDEKKGLDEIASRSGEPGLAYGTDEETPAASTPTRTAGGSDMSDNLVEFAEQQAKVLAAQTMPTGRR